MVTDDGTRQGEDEPEVAEFGDDAVLTAIDDVARAVEENVNDEQELLTELARVRGERIAGVPLTQAIGEGGRPRLLLLLGRVVNRLVAGSAGLRRALVTSLVDEGETVVSVARRFEVTHQRISSILRRSSN